MWTTNKTKLYKGDANNRILTGFSSLELLDKYIYLRYMNQRIRQTEDSLIKLGSIQ